MEVLADDDDQPTFRNGKLWIVAWVMVFCHQKPVVVSVNPRIKFIKRPRKIPPLSTVGE